MQEHVVVSADQFYRGPATHIDVVNSQGQRLFDIPINLEQMIRDNQHSVEYTTNDGVYAAHVEVTDAARGSEDRRDGETWFQEVDAWYDESEIAPARSGRSTATRASSAPKVTVTKEPAVAPKEHTPKAKSPAKRKVQHTPLISRWKELGAQTPARSAVEPPNLRHGKLKTIFLNPDASEHKFTPLALGRHSAVSYREFGHDKMVVYGGANGLSIENEVYELHMTGGSWRRLETKGQAPPGSYFHTCSVFLDQSTTPEIHKMIVIGGIGLGGAVTTFASLDGNSYLELRHAVLFSQREREKSAQPQAAVPPENTQDGRGLLPSIFVFKVGTRYSEWCLECHRFEYTFTPGEWKKPVNNFPISVAGHTTIIYEDQAITFGGVTPGMNILNDMIGVDVNTFASEIILPEDERATAPCPRFFHAAVNYRGQMIVCGGCNSKNETLSDIWTFWLEARRWELLPCSGEMPRRYGHAMAVAGTRLLIVGGSSAFSSSPTPLRSVIELNLMPTETSFISREVKVDPVLPRLLFPCAAPASDDASIVLFGGLGELKRGTTGSKPPSTATAAESQPFASPARVSHKEGPAPAPKKSPRGRSKSPGGSIVLAEKNWTFVVGFAARKQKGKKGAEADSDDEKEEKKLSEIRPGMEDFLRRTKDTQVKQHYDLTRTQEDLSLQARENTEPRLYLKKEEIDSLLKAADTLVETLEKYKVSDIQSNVPDRDIRVKSLADCISNAKQARDILRSMKKKPQSATKTPKAKTHRRKTGEKFEDFSSAKPFRQVMVLHLLGQAKVVLTDFNLMLPQIESEKFMWEQKQEFVDWVRGCKSAMDLLLLKIKEIRKSYIEARTASLMENEERHKVALQRLTQIVRKIQHDKIWKKPSQDREKSKQTRLKDLKKDEAKKQQGGVRGPSPKQTTTPAAAAGLPVQQTVRQSSRSQSPSPRSAKPPLPHVVYVASYTKRDEQNVLELSALARQAATELMDHVAALPPELSPTDPPSAAVPPTPNAPSEIPQPAPAQPPTPAVQPPTTAGAAPPTPPMTKQQLSAAAKKGIIKRCEQLMAQLKGIESSFGVTGNTVNDLVLATTRRCRDLCRRMKKCSTEVLIPNPTQKPDAPRNIHDRTTMEKAKLVDLHTQATFQSLKFVFLSKSANTYRMKQKVESCAVLPPQKRRRRGRPSAGSSTDAATQSEDDPAAVTSASENEMAAASETAATPTTLLQHFDVSTAILGPLVWKPREVEKAKEPPSEAAAFPPPATQVPSGTAAPTEAPQGTQVEAAKPATEAPQGAQVEAAKPATEAPQGTQVEAAKPATEAPQGTQVEAAKPATEPAPPAEAPVPPAGDQVATDVPPPTTSAMVVDAFIPASSTAQPAAPIATTPTPPPSTPSQPVESKVPDPKQEPPPTTAVDGAPAVPPAPVPPPAQAQLPAATSTAPQPPMTTAMQSIAAIPIRVQVSDAVRQALERIHSLDIRSPATADPSDYVATTTYSGGLAQGVHPFPGSIGQEPVDITSSGHRSGKVQGQRQTTAPPPPPRRAQQPLFNTKVLTPGERHILLMREKNSHW